MRAHDPETAAGLRSGAHRAIREQVAAAPEEETPPAQGAAFTLVNRPEEIMDPALRAIVAALRTRGMSDEVIQQALTTAELTSRPLRTVLVDDQIVTEFQLASAVAEAYGVEAVELSNFPIDPAAMARSR